MAKLSGVIFDGTKRQGNVFLEIPEPQPPPIITSYRPPQTFTPPEPVKISRQSSLRPLILTLSTGLISISLFGLLFLFWPVLVQEVRYRLILSHQGTAEEKIVPGFPQGDTWTPPNTTFSLIIPKIDAKAPIIANIDSADEKAYMEALKKGVVHAKGTCFPGMDCRMYLFAHSAGSSIIAARYNAVFYLLRKLETGDTFIVYYYGKKFLYEVTGKEITSPDDVQYISEPGDKEELVLQTCDPPGTTKNRLLVFAKPRLVEYLK